MIYAFDLYLMNYATNITRPIGYDFADFQSFPTPSEIYQVLGEKYGVVKDCKDHPIVKLLGGKDSPIIGMNFRGDSRDFRIIVNNVRPIGKVKDKDKYLS